MQPEEAREQIKQGGVIAIVRGDFSLENLLAIAEALLAADLRIFEVTLNTTGALEAIAALRRRFPQELLVAAGTVRDAAAFDRATAAGAQFTIAPNCDPATIARARETGVLHLPGVFTPTEVQTAFAHGCRMVKLAPCDIVGAKHLRVLRAPLDDVEFVPTGGITVQTIAEFARAGAAAVGVGGSLIPKTGWPLPDITATARALRAAWLAAKAIPM